MLVDAFLFFNELDILDIRLNTLYDIVDFFIISESTKTHSGHPKPLYFMENRERFKKFDRKIIHQVIEDTPDDFSTPLQERKGKEYDPYYNVVVDKVNRGDWWPHNVPSYGRDTFEKESLFRAFYHLEDYDLDFEDVIVMLSDADEIPNPDTVKRITDWKYYDPTQIYNLKQNMYFYYLNLLKEDNWYGTTILSLELFKNLSMCELRVRRGGAFVENGGWHFSYMGGTDKILQKLESFGEQSLNTPEIRNNVKINVDNCIQSERDLFGRPCKFWKVPIDESYPKYLRENLDKFGSFVLD